MKNIILDGSYRTVKSNEILNKKDLIRSVFAISSNYKPDEWDMFSFHTIENDMPGWIGETFKDYMKSIGVPKTNMKEYFKKIEILRRTSSE